MKKLLFNCSYILITAVAFVLIASTVKVNSEYVFVPEKFPLITKYVESLMINPPGFYDAASPYYKDYRSRVDINKYEDKDSICYITTYVSTISTSCIKK